MEEILKSIPGAIELFTWFGYWPGFHDAEIVSLRLNRSGASTLQIHTWHTTDQVDVQGYYIMEKHLLVCFQMEEIISLSLSDFNSQNVISGLGISQSEDGFIIDIDPCYGLSGRIAARKISIEIEPLPAGLC